MNALRIFLFAVIAFAVLMTTTAAAPIVVTDPTNAPFLDNAYHVIPANTTLWYRFNYAGDHSQMTIRLPDGADNGLQFMVHTPGQMQEWWKNPSPIGYGTPHKGDLLWSGNSNEGGTYFVELMNYTAQPVAFQFDAVGKGISTQAAGQTGVVAPATSAVAAVVEAGNDAPSRAIPVGNQEYTIPGKSTLWYSIDYPGDRSVMVVTVPQGATEKLRYMIHTPAQLARWWEATPIGQGSPHKGDLIWTLNSPQGGRYYIEMVNDNPYAVGFEIDVR